MNVLDLFCGAGGFSTGFEQSGQYNILIGVDNDPYALRTFARNHPKTESLELDLSDQKSDDVIQSVAVNRCIDVIIAGPPCQGFSLTGPRQIDDPRNSLYLAVLRAIRQYTPAAFIVENVPGMRTMYNGQIHDEILRRMTALGYNVQSEILCAADYGVPQMRKRLFFMGIRKDLGEPAFPQKLLTPSAYISCRDAISDLSSRIETLGTEFDVYDADPKTEYQRAMRGTCTVLSNHVATKHKQFVVDVISQVPEGGNWKDLPPGVGESRKFHEAWTRYDGNKPSRTIDCGHRNHFHYEYNRIPTVRENARLQSFPDNFIFLGTRSQQHRQIGNAVPPLLGKAIASKLHSILQEGGYVQ